jgi:hypothetical protein
MSGSLWKKELSLRRKATEAAKPAPPVETAAVEVEQDGAPPLPATSGDYGWLTESFDPTDVPDGMPAVVAPTVGSVPSREQRGQGGAAPAVVPAAAAVAPARSLWKRSCR